jgi:hypothetical protein
MSPGIFLLSRLRFSLSFQNPTFIPGGAWNVVLMRFTGNGYSNLWYVQGEAGYRYFASAKTGMTWAVYHTKVIVIPDFDPESI